MTDFLDTALRFPATLFSVMLVVVVVYWVIVLLGVIGLDAFDGDGELGPAGALAAVGLGGVPVSVVLSLWIAFAWFASFAGTAGFDFLDSSGSSRLFGGAGLLVAATVAAYFVTYALVVPLRRLFPEVPPPARGDFVGRECVVRTTAVDREYGQAEVTAPDGSSAVIQVRQTGEEELSAGSTALIFDYDTDGEFFWITVARTET